MYTSPTIRMSVLIGQGQLLGDIQSNSEGSHRTTGHRS